MGNGIDTTYLNKYSMTDYTTLFDSLPKKDETSFGLVGLATEYNTIRNGSYGKLLSAYYKKMDTDSKSEAIEKEIANRKVVGGNASALRSAAEKLANVDFKKVSEEDSLKAAKEFVSAYNSVVDTADDVDSKSILRNAVWMTNMTKQNAGLLSEVGITIGDDNQLTLDETKWKEASATSKSSLFSGRYGFAEKILYKANQLTKASGEKVSNKASAYTEKGDYTKVDSESVYDDLF